MTLVGDLVHSVGFVAKQKGWKSVPGLLFHPLFEHNSGFILCGSLKDAVLPIPSKIPIVLREAELTDLPKFHLTITPLQMRRFEHKIRMGESCAIALIDDELVAYVWAAFAGCPTVKEVPFTLRPEDTYLWGAYCRPEYRNRGVFSSLASYHEYLLYERGYEMTYRFTRYNNEAVLRLCEKLKLKIVGRVTSFRIFGWQFFNYEIIET